MTSIPRKSSVVLWAIAPVLITLSSVRPPSPRSDRASNLPTELGEFSLKKKRTITGRHIRLLGTRDVAWLVFEDAEKHEIFLTAVFHDVNWKSLHPPNICIRGSNFNINSDDGVPLTLSDGRRIHLGRLHATDATSGRDYVSLYAFVGSDFVTHSYARFYWNHFPRALFRQATSGFLVRVESFVRADGLKAAEARCWSLFQEFLPVGEALIRER